MDNSLQNNPSKIIGIQFSVFSPEEIEKYSVVEVTNKETYVGIKPKIGGLFDPRMGVSEPGMICPTDSMNYINSPGYFGHVKLSKPVFYIQYLDTIIDILKCVCNKCGKLLISKKTYHSLMNYPSEKRWQKVLELCKNPQLKRCGDETDNGCGCMRASKIKQEGFASIVAEWSNMSESYTMKITPEMAINILKKISDEDVNFMGFSNIWSRPEWMICKTFAVPPPAVRPSVKHDAQQRSEDDLTHIIINIIKINTKIKQLTESGEQDNQKNIEDWVQVLQYYIATMVDNNISGASPVTQRSGRALKSISERHKGKQGRVRGNLMGKRVDFSARSVITPDPELSISELGVPLKIAKNITKPVKVQSFNYKYLSYLVKNGPHNYPGAKLIEKPNGVTISLGYIDRDNVKIEIGDIVHRHMLDGDVVLFNRQPTLHRMSMMAHIVRVMKVGDTFRMNVADTKPYNADFDGDEMNMHMPQNDEAECELKYLANIPNHIISPGNNKPIIGIFQDSMIGSFLYTRENISFTKKQAMNLLTKTNCFNTSSLFSDNDKEEYSNFEVLSEIVPNISLKYKTDLFTDNEEYQTSNHVLEINDGTIIRGQHDKGVFGSSSEGIIHRIRKDFGSDACKNYIDNLQAIITEYMKTTGFSVGISDLIADEETNQKINDIIHEKKTEVSNIIDQIHLGIFENKTGKSNLEEFESQVNNILNKASNDAGKAGVRSLDKENRFVSIVTSGSKGNELNISQMISCLGQQNVDGKRIPYGYTNRTLPHFKQFDDTPKARGFVESSFIGGLTPDELFFHAMGGRVGLIDTAVKTSTTGYIQRRLIKGMEDIQVAYDFTIRNNKNKVIQFSYGGTNWDTTLIESMQFELVDNKIMDIYKNYSYEFMNKYDDMNVKQARKNTHLKLIYDTKSLSRFKDQKEDLKKRCLDDIDYLLKRRDSMITEIYNNEDEKKIYLPIHFTNTIERVKNHFQITNHSLSNITPYEAYDIIDRKYEVLNQMFKPCEKFKIAYTYYMNPYNLIHNNKYNRDAIIFLCETIINIYKQSIVNPGEMVGMVGAQSIGEPTTQMTLNTFHFAGVSSKSNVTRGVPRIEELLTLTKNPKNPSLTIYLDEETSKDINSSYKIASKIEHTRLIDIVKKAEIFYEPDEFESLIDDDDQIMKEYVEFSDIIRKCYGEEKPENEEEDEGEDEENNNWIIRLELNETLMFDMNITNEDIHYILKTESPVLQGSVQCFYTDYNSDDKIIFRIRVNIDNKNGIKKKDIFTEEDYIHYVKTYMDKILNDLVVRGTKNIEKVNLRKINNYKIKNNETGDFDKKEIYVLDTIGTNLSDILKLNYIDKNKTFSNDVIEMKNILGIEAARKCLFNEILEVMEFDSTYINHHHIHLLCDRMTCNHKMVSIFRHGINKDDIGPIAKASFEETTEMFLQAAKHGELDNMRGVSANVMCGQEGYYGTSAFQIHIDNEVLKKNNEELISQNKDEIQKDDEIYTDDFMEPEEVMKLEEDKNNNSSDKCSIESLKTATTMNTTSKNTIINNDYDLNI